MARGYLAIVLHAYLPYVRHPEYEDALEENWFYEAMTETYLPLLLVLENLVEDGIDFRLSVSLTPTLISMLADPFLQSRYLQRIERSVELADREISRTKSQPDFHRLARMYHRRFLQIRDAFVNRYAQNPLLAFERLQQGGKLEIIASAATHGYLPLLFVNASAVRGQVHVGIDQYQQVFGRSPAGFWLPECGYYSGVDELLSAYGIRYTIVETHGVTRADPRPRYGVYAPIFCPSGLAVFGRDPESSKHVWSSIEGYPGDYDYREFYRDIGYDLDLEYIKPYIHRDGIRIDTGIKYYRITGKTDHKEVYVPEWAERKAGMHAADFIANRQRQIDYLAPLMNRRPVVVAPYDAELFGHWWFEGPDWLDHLIRRIATEQQSIRLITLSEYLEEHPVNQVAAPSACSWGHKGFNEVWLNCSNDWIYRHLHRGADVLQDLAARYPRAPALTRRALNQAARELLLAQASDWAFMINSGAMEQYGRARTNRHLCRFQKLTREISAGVIDDAWLSTVEDQDNIFPRINYCWFA
jgi:1,4-alpha-glucan branching enzyme